MAMQFKKATKQQARLRLALIGPSGSGKTYSALSIGKHLGQRIAVIDTERGSASKYAGLFEFDVLELDTFSPNTYVEAIHAAEAAGYEVLVIDSLSHAWMGKEGALEQVDKAAKRSPSNNSYTAWRDVTPMHNALIDAMLQSPCHVIVTMRAKTEYVMEPNERGKMTPRKVGMAPIQRDGMEYEFDVVADMNLDNDFIVSKSRCPALSGAVINKPGQQVADTLKAWLSDGSPAQAQLPAEPIQPAPAPEPQPTAPTTNGNGNSKAHRPYPAEIVKAGIDKMAAKHQGKAANDKQRGLLVSMAEKCYAGDGASDKRHAAFRYLTGAASVKEMPDNYVIAMLDWLKPSQDSGGDYLPDPMAETEAQAVFTASLTADGQGSLL